MTQTANRPDAPPDHASVEPLPRRRLLTRLSMGHVIMVLAGLVAFLLVLAVLREQGDRATIAVASVDLDAGTRIELSDVRYAEVSDSDEALLTAFLAPETVDQAVAEGWVVTRTVRTGTPLTTADFRRQTAGSDLRAMSVPISVVHAVNGAIVTGDRVDLIAVNRGVASYVVTDVEVIAVSSSDGSVGRSDFAITIAVDDATSLRVASAINTGSLEIVRSTGAAPADPSGRFDPQANPDGMSVGGDG